ncbi:hypothetical protein E6W39_03565 [Kitasatospora acidiphila]|uniref:Tetratricopeptide repeat protein n=1 Tax=Kitasatospora acidiphila TaxID=2567942 RepID=A0A540VXL6_9ACTN|nr:hypothetical protein [Kitasatospora acidiphila]TQF01491.1 hypothetical protein E6W39_03565 [Kitasatospora acidiphila]
MARHDSGHLPEALDLLDEVVEETDDTDARLRRAQVLIALGRDNGHVELAAACQRLPAYNGATALTAPSTSASVLSEQGG